MSELLKLFAKLSEFYDRNFLWEQIEEKYEKAIENRSKVDTDGAQKNEKKRKEDDNASSDIDDIARLPFVRQAIKDSQVLGTMLELSTFIRNLRAEPANSYDNTYDCWDQVVKESPRDPYLAFIYALASLGTLDPSSSLYIKISLAAVNTYVLSLTIPGAKGYHVFDEDVIEHCLKVFTVLERIQDDDIVHKMSRNDSVAVWVTFVTFCEDFKLLFRYVHFNDLQKARDSILKRFTDILYMNYKRGFANIYAANMHTKCFEIFEETINAHNGEPEDTLMLLINRTTSMHTYATRPKGSTSNINADDSEHISDWFIKIIAKYPRLLTKVLGFFIECVITNPLRSWKSEQTQRALDYAAKYDAALFTKCNESSVEFLCEAIQAEEVAIRSRVIELISRILQIESKVDWQMFRHEVSDIPREVHLIKVLIDSLQDCNNNVKLKAVQALQSTLAKGSPNAQKILSEAIQFAQFNDPNVLLPDEPPIRKHELRYAKPNALSPQYTFEGFGIIELPILHMPEYTYTRLFHSSVSHLRRAGIMFIEQMIKLNPLVIFNTNFVEATTRLAIDPVALVRKQAMLSVDALLQSYPNCYAIIWVWSKIWAPMLSDGDVKNIEIAMECFRNRVLLNLNGFDSSNKPEHYMPWVIIRTLLCTQPRNYLQNCFHKAYQQRMITPKILSIVESHLLTSNSTEAWVVLNFISGKMKSKEPDALIHMFTTLESWSSETNMCIAMEVLSNCLNDFSHTALNHVFNYVLNSIRSGKIMRSLIAKAIDFLGQINTHSEGKSKKNTQNAWLNELHNYLEQAVLNGIQYFPGNSYTFQSHIGAYAEVIVMLPIEANPTIIAFVHKFMSECIKLRESELDTENERIFIWMILIATRLSLRDSTVASTTCQLFSNILHRNDRPQIVNAIILSLTDLGKKHTHIVERMIERVLLKLSSPYAVNRIATFKCFQNMVLQDQMKLRGSVLLALLSALLDDSYELAELADKFFIEYLKIKNPALFRKCLIECPYVLNEFKNFEGMDSFQEAVKSPLKGNAKSKNRRLLYNHLMSNMDDINLVMYFGQLKSLAEKSKSDPMMKCAEGIALVKDVLFILRRICQLTKEQKSTTDENKETDENDDAAAVALEETNTSAATEEPTATAGGAGGRGRRRREVATMADALKHVERSFHFIPTIYENVKSSDETLQKHFDDLGKAMSVRFSKLFEYVKLPDFWKNYWHSKVIIAGTSKKKKKRKRAAEKDDSGDEMETDEIENRNCDDMEAKAENDLDSDNELPLTRNKSRIGKAHRCGNASADVSMDYIFNPIQYF